MKKISHWSWAMLSAMLLITIVSCQKKVDSPQSGPADILIIVNVKPERNYYAYPFYYAGNNHWLPSASVPLESRNFPDTIRTLYPDPDYAEKKPIKYKLKLKTAFYNTLMPDGTMGIIEYQLQNEDWVEISLFANGKLYDYAKGREIEVNYPK